MRTTATVNNGVHYAIPQCNRSLVTNEEEMADPTPPTAAPANFETSKWTDEDTRHLIAWRAANTSRAQYVLKTRGWGGKISTQQVKRKWENLTAKYKDLRKPQSGVGTEDGKATAASWNWYSEMDGILGQKPSISPPVVISSSGQVTAVATPSSVPCTSADDTITPPPNKRRSSGAGTGLMELMELMERRERLDLEREREAREQERRWRQLEEREERREERRGRGVEGAAGERDGGEEGQGGKREGRKISPLVGANEGKRKINK
ncbi:unnamed protein product [Boreogadus saida]